MIFAADATGGRPPSSFLFKIMRNNIREDINIVSNISCNFSRVGGGTRPKAEMKKDTFGNRFFRELAPIYLKLCFQQACSIEGKVG